MHIAIDGESCRGPRGARCIALFPRGKRPQWYAADSEPGLLAQVPAA